MNELLNVKHLTVDFSTDQGTVLVKSVDWSEGAIWFAHGVKEHLAAQGFLIFSEFADAGDLYFGAPARKSLKTLDFSREGSVGVQGATRFKPCNSGHLLRYLRSVYVQYTSFICLANDRNCYG